jgi:hypothetical protein
MFHFLYTETSSELSNCLPGLLVTFTVWVHIFHADIYSAHHDISSNANCHKNLLNLRNICWKLYTAAQLIKFNTIKTVNQV